jgi:hypothetical protein
MVGEEEAEDDVDGIYFSETARFRDGDLGQFRERMYNGCVV